MLQLLLRNKVALALPANQLELEFLSSLRFRALVELIIIVIKVKVSARHTALRP